MAWISVYILSFLLACAGGSSKGLEEKKQQLGFRPVHFAAVGLPLRDTSPNGDDLKTGAFKIDDGNVVGAGTYEIEPDGVDVDINLKISTKEQGIPSAGGGPGAGGGPAAGGEPGAGGGPGVGGGPGTGAGPGAGGGPGTGGGPGANGGAGAGGRPGAGGASKPALCAVPCSQTKPTQGPGVVTTSVPPTTGIGGGGATGPNVATQGTTSPSGTQQVTTPQGATLPSGTPTTSATGTGPTTGVGTATTPPSGGSQDEILGLNKHNEYRKVHGVPAMKLNAEMSRQAAEYARKIAQQGVLSHASAQERNNDGENLSMGCDTDGQTTTEATTNWYNEVCKPGYTFGQESGGGGTGHFTQVVWKESVELGIGKADIDKDGMKCTYVVGRYRPAGNMIGDYAKNVPQGSFNKAQACAGVKRTISHYLTSRSKIHHKKYTHTAPSMQ